MNLAEAKELLPSELADNIPDNVSGGANEDSGQYSVLKRFVKNCGAYNAFNGIELPIFYNAPADWKFYQSSINLTLFSIFLQVSSVIRLIEKRVCKIVTTDCHAGYGTRCAQSSLGGLQKI